jgi:hypothetical protein
MLEIGSVMKQEDVVDVVLERLKKRSDKRTPHDGEENDLVVWPSKSAYSYSAASALLNSSESLKTVWGKSNDFSSLASLFHPYLLPYELSQLRAYVSSKEDVQFARTSAELQKLETDLPPSIAPLDQKALTVMNRRRKYD